MTISLWPSAMPLTPHADAWKAMPAGSAEPSRPTKVYPEAASASCFRKRGMAFSTRPTGGRSIATATACYIQDSTAWTSAWRSASSPASSPALAALQAPQNRGWCRVSGPFTRRSRASCWGEGSR